MSKISAFLDAKGSLDVLLLLAGGEKSFNDLKKSLGLSPNTVLDRLREAQRLDLAREELFRDPGGRSRIKYTLTDKGGKIIGASKHIMDSYMKLRRQAERFENQKREKEMEMKELLSSLQKSSAVISISGSTIKAEGDVMINAETVSENGVNKKTEKK